MVIDIPQAPGIYTPGKVKRAVPLLALVILAGTSCVSAERPRTVVATTYPLAWGARHLASIGYGWRVIDLSPDPGMPVGKVALSSKDREAIRRAGIVLYLGDVGFQPEVEEAVRAAEGDVVKVSDCGPGCVYWGRGYQDPWVLHEMLEKVAVAFGEVDPSRAWEYESSTDPGLRLLSEKYGEALAACRYELLIVPREAYRPLASWLGLEQLALIGPDGELRHERLEEARRRLAGGEAGAVFYDPSGFHREEIERFGAGAGVSALPLDPMDSRPAAGDYLTVARANLESLLLGLDCRSDGYE